MEQPITVGCLESCDWLLHCFIEVNFSKLTDHVVSSTLHTAKTMLCHQHLTRRRPCSIHTLHGADHVMKFTPLRSFQCESDLLHNMFYTAPTFSQWTPFPAQHVLHRSDIFTMNAYSFTTCSTPLRPFHNERHLIHNMFYTAPTFSQWTHTL